MHASPYALKELIYIYDNLGSQFLINPLNITAQILKSPSPSVGSSKGASDVTRMSTLRFANTNTKIHPFYNPRLLSPKLKKMTKAMRMSGQQQNLHILTFIQTNLRDWFKSSACYCSADDSDPCFFVVKTKDKKSDTQTRAESQISKSAENMKGFIHLQN